MTHAEKCPICHGRGKLTYQLYYGESFTSGGMIDHMCHGCNGKGWVEVNDNNMGCLFPNYNISHQKSTTEGGV